MRRFVVALALLSLPAPSQATWTSNGIPVSVAPDVQTAPHVVADGSGGTFIVWEDRRGGDADVYAQHLSRAGDPLWTSDGISIVAGSGDQTGVVAIADGAGGLIVGWLDTFNGAFDVYVQRLDDSGVPLWTAGGVPACTAAGIQTAVQMLADGSGGAFLVWADARAGAYDILAQHVDASGSASWTANGVAVCVLAGVQSLPRICTDDAGGVILAWVDHRGASNDIYAQRLNAAGSAQWTPNGVGVGTTSGDENWVEMTPDGLGGTIVAWRRLQLNNDRLHVQRLDADGAAQWFQGSAPPVVSEYGATDIKITGDDAGGAIVVWNGISHVYGGLLAQRISAMGLAQWADEGVFVATDDGAPSSVRVTRDGAGATIVAWSDTRSGSSDVFAQRIYDQSGTPVWLVNGLAIAAGGSAQLVTGISLDRYNGAVLAWSADGDVHAQRIDRQLGAWGIPDPLLGAAADVPADQGGVVLLDWNASDRDTPAWQLITHYSVWRATDFVPAGVATSMPAQTADHRAAVTYDFSGNARFVQTTPEGVYYWEWVGNEPATEAATYAFPAATRADAVGGDPALHYFEVLAHTAEPFTFWESDVITGSSVDNLAPAAPLTLAAQREGADVTLTWLPSGQNEADFMDYALYRASFPGVPVDPLNLVATTENLTFEDTGVPLTALYYVVVARDVHGNVSIASNEASLPTPTGTGDTPELSSLQLRPNYPNPFHDSTRFEVGLPARSSITTEVFDVAGHLIRKTAHPDASRGWHAVEFDGRDARGRALPSGVYFLRVRAGSETRTMRMVVQR